jgi:hypothetical protein
VGNPQAILVNAASFAAIVTIVSMVALLTVANLFRIVTLRIPRGVFPVSPRGNPIYYL